MGFFDKLKVSLMKKATANVMTHLQQQYLKNNLRITRRASQPEDAVTPERLSAITYEFAEREATAMGAAIRSMKYNPDRGTELEPAEMAQQPGEVTDRVLAGAILQGLVAETTRAVAGQDPDVDFGVPTRVENTDGVLPVYRTAWVKRDETAGQKPKR